jgi:Ohr subfamily peroxiredoxin
MNTIDQVLYTGKTHTTGGREGAARSDDGRLDIILTPPGSHGKGTNPEQLFAAGWSACFLGALGRAARDRHIALPSETAIDAEVDLGVGADGFLLQARLRVAIPGLSSGIAEELIDAAHQICPYSKMTRNNINVDLVLA